MRTGVSSWYLSVFGVLAAALWWQGLQLKR